MKNLATWDRAVRLLAAAAAGACAFLAPLPLAVRIAGLAASSLYLAATALTGTCLGYRLLGVSSCPRSEAR